MKGFLFGIMFCSTLACASMVNTGTYIGAQSKRSNLSYYQDEGTYQYVLYLASLSTQETLKFHYAGSRQLETGKAYSFKVEPNPYDDETPTSQCVLILTWHEDGRLEIMGNAKCDGTEKHFFSDYSYSAQASLIPNEYRGNWDTSSICGDDRTVILEDVFNPSYYTGAATLIGANVAKDGSLDVVGIEEYERETSISQLNFKLMKNRLRVRGNHHEAEFDKTVMRCQVVNE